MWCPARRPADQGQRPQASNIPGIRRDAFLAGVRIERMYLFGPLPGFAAMITLVATARPRA